jgi:hypothetical protein
MAAPSDVNRAQLHQMKIASFDEPRPRGIVIGKPVTGPPLSEAENFRKCPFCGGYVDMRDRAWLDEHQQPPPHPACDGRNARALSVLVSRFVGGAGLLR